MDAFSVLGSAKIELGGLMGNVFLLLFILLGLGGCTNSNEKEILQILDQNVGVQHHLEEARRGLNQSLGTEDSVFKKSLLDFVKQRTVVEYSEIQIIDSKAKVKVTMKMPHPEDLGGVLMLGNILGFEKLKKMTLSELIKEVDSGSRRMASTSDIRTKLYEYQVQLEKVNGQWMILR